MAYTKVAWKDGTDGGTPVSAANLNKMDDGIATLDTEVGTLSQLQTTATSSVVEAINEVVSSSKAKGATLEISGNSLYLKDSSGNTLSTIDLGGISVSAIKSIQRGTYNVTPSTVADTTISYSSIDTSKSIILIDAVSIDGSDLGKSVSAACTYFGSTSATIKCAVINSTSVLVSWQIVEYA